MEGVLSIIFHYIYSIIYSSKASKDQCITLKIRVVSSGQEQVFRSVDNVKALPYPHPTLHCLRSFLPFLCTSPQSQPPPPLPLGGFLWTLSAVFLGQPVLLVALSKGTERQRGLGVCAFSPYRAIAALKGARKSHPHDVGGTGVRLPHFWVFLEDQTEATCGDFRWEAPFFFSLLIFSHSLTCLPWETFPSDSLTHTSPSWHLLL